MATRTVLILILAGLLALATAPALAGEAITDLATGPTSITFSPKVDYASVVLTVSGPGETSLRYELSAGQVPAINLRDRAGNLLADGSYTWELRLNPLIDADTRAALAAARLRDDTSIVDTLRQQGRLPAEPLVQSGTFTILDGLVVAPDQEETSLAAGVSRDGKDLSSLAEETTISGDLSVYNSLCVGFDCLASETYGFDTIRLKENSLRIHFDDTSTLSGFPNRDWRLVANDSGSGGANKFSIEDSTGATTPFTIEAGAVNNALYVDTSRRVGFGTATPVVNLHTVTGNTPTLRLEQDGSSGFAPQTWDVAGNETNFFVRDVTGGSRLPLRIRPGAPTSSIDIAADGDVGIGTASPDAKLDIENNGLPFGFRLTNSASGGSFWDTKQSTSGYAISKDTEAAWLLIFDDGRVRMGPGTTADPTFLLQTNGNLEIGGTLTQNSDVHSKRDFAPVNGAEVLSKIMALPISTWSFKSDDPEVRHMGPMAQDFHAAFGLGAYDNRLAPVDVDGAALAAIQELNRQLQAKDAQLDAVNARLAQMDALQARLEALEARLAQQP